MPLSKPQWFLIAVLVGASGQCSSDSGNSSTPSSDWYANADSGANALGDFGLAAIDSGPPEQQVSSAYRAPVATGHYVWVANSVDNDIAYIDASTFEIRLANAGNAPTYMVAVPGQDDATLVLNVLSNDLTYLRAAADGTLTSQTFAVVPGLNSLAVSSDGHWAIAWTNAQLVSTSNELDGFQYITVVDLTGAVAPATLSAGYRPSQVAFDVASQRAYVVSEKGITRIELAGQKGPASSVYLALPAPAAIPPPSADAGADADATDADAGAATNAADADAGEAIADAATTSAQDTGAVSDAINLVANVTATAPEYVTITSSGKYALVRYDGYPNVTFVDLDAQTTSDVILSDAVTGLQITGDDAWGVAVVRATSMVTLFSLAQISAGFANTLTNIHVENGQFGSVAQSISSDHLLLYTNATPVNVLTVLDQTSGLFSVRAIDTMAPIYAAFPTRDASFGLVLQTTSDPIGDALTQSSTNPYAAPNPQVRAFSLVPLAESLPPVIVATTAPVSQVALSPDNASALVIATDSTTSTYTAFIAALPSMAMTTVHLASPPTAGGIVAGAGVAWIAQDFSDGRITFVHLATGVAHTITGFEINARIAGNAQ